ncbi:MAG: ADP-glyceromanno-heptose 6-epimerase [Bacteroidota bacterium]
MIILTGGAGFIGSCFLAKLNECGLTDILVVDRLGNENKWKNLKGKRFSGYEHKDAFRNKLNNGFFDNLPVKAIIHFGACSSTTETNADYLLDNNFNYSKELAEFAVKRKIRFIYASSAATYGDGKLGYSDNLFNELSPLNMYGFSKHLFDLWLIEKGYVQKVTGLKFFNVFGPNEYHKGDMASMIFKSFNQIKDQGKVKLFKSNDKSFKDGEQLRDFIYVNDAVEIVWKIFKNKNVSGIFNLGSGKARNWNDLTNAVFSALNIEKNIEYIEMPDSLKKQYQNFTQAEMDKLFRAIGEYKFSSLEDSINDYVKNYLSEDKYI